MNSKKLSFIILSFIFVFVLVLRLYLSSNLEYFSDDASYYYLGILEISILTPVVLKILAEVLFASTIFIVYFIARELTENEWGSLFAASISLTVPLFFILSFNSLSFYNFLIPLFFFAVLCLLKIKEKKFQVFLILSSILLGLTHKISLILPLVFLFYIFILEAYGNKPGELEKNSMILSAAIIVLCRFLIGDLFYNNMIPKIIEDQFPSLTIASFSYLVGFLPLIFGISGLYFGYFREKSKKTYLLTSITLSILLLLSFRLITTVSGIIFLGIALSILAGISLPYLLNYLQKTKLNSIKLPVAILIFLIILSLIRPVMEIREKPIVDVGPILWLNENSKENTKVLSNIFEGNLITYFAKKNVITHYPYTEQNANQRFKNIRQLYTSTNSNKAYWLLKGYNINYIYFSPQSKEMYGINELQFINKNDKRFKKIFDDSKTQIWERQNA